MSETLKPLLDKLADIGKKQDGNKDAMDKINTRLDSLEKPVYPANATPDRVFGPNVRRGENVMTSRGFQFYRMAGALSGELDRDSAKVELMLADKLHHHLVKSMGTKGYTMAAGSPYHVGKSSLQFSKGFLVPFATDFMPEEAIGAEAIHEIKSLTFAGVEKADPQEMAWLRAKYYSAPGQKAGPQSWLDETLGGPLVPPPEMGELIDLLRNKEALINAGVRVIPLPPQGRIVFPRQTSATTGYYVGENTAVTTSQFGTGQLVLQAKKVAAITTMPNELIRFGGPAAESLLRQDMTKTLTLTMDYALLQGGGSDNSPLGLINTDGVVSLTATTTGANGDTFAPQDIYAFPSAIMANNAEMEGYIMRPESYWSILKNRSATGAGAGSGLFMFNPGRDLNHKFNYVVGGMPSVLTPQISNARVKGSGTTNTYIVGGMWTDYILGMYGAIEFAATAVSDSTFGSDQTAVRSILSHDGGPRHPGAFAYMDNLAAFNG